MRTLLFMAAFVVATLAFFLSNNADASPKLAVDADLAVPLGASSPSLGVGGGVRFGYQLSLPRIAVTPEVAADYTSFGTQWDSILRGTAGARIGFGDAIRPGVFGHVGISNAGKGATTFDAGAFLDFTLLPIIDLGAHLAYVTTTAGFRWLAPGAHLSFTF